MLKLLGSMLEIFLFLITWRVGVAQEDKQKRESLAKEASDAIASGRISRINSVVVKLRHKR